MEDLEFNSITEMAQYLESTERLPGAGEFSIRDQSARECSMTWDQTMDLARNGGYWIEGAEQMVDGMANATALRENHAQPMIQYDVAGFMPDVPAYLAGQPDCMMQYDEGDMTVAQMPTVTIGVGTFSHAVAASSAFNRGVAILSLIDAIEAVGYRVQLDFVGDNREMFGSASVKRIRVVLKRAQDHWNPGNVAFATANAAMLRRLTVACLERDEDTVPRTQAGYGQGDDGYIEEYSLAFPYMVSNRGYETLPKALASVQSMAEDYGIECNLTGASA